MSEFQLECRRLSAACSQVDPKDRPEIDNVVDCLLNTIPEDAESLEKLGLIAMLHIMDAEPWDAARKLIEERQRRDAVMPQLDRRPIGNAVARNAEPKELQLLEL